MHLRFRAIFILCVSASLRLTSHAAAQAPEVAGVFPAGGPRGADTTVQFQGKNLAGARLRVSGIGISVKQITANASGTELTAALSVAKDARLGPRELRLVGAKGISNGTRFWVDRLPNVIPSSSSAETDRPHTLDRSGGAVVNGRIGKIAARDRFAFDARAGETWVFLCRAFRLHSRLDPVFELRDEAGRMLALAQNTWEADPTFVFRAPKTGKYLVTLRDSEYKGGPNFTYRLTAGVVPAIVSRLPLGGAPGSDVKLLVRGPNLDAGTVTVGIPPELKPGVFWTEIGAAGGGGATIPLLVDEGTVTCASETGEMTLPALPAIVDGVFTSRSATRIRFHAPDKRKLLFDLLGRRIGSRIDGSLRVLDAAGKEVFSNDDAAGKDARMEFIPPGSGDYVLEIANVEEKTGPDCYWRLKVQHVKPDFRIELRTDRVHVPAGATIALPVEVIRSGGFTGPVEIRAEGLPAGVTATPATVPPDKTQAQLTFNAATDAPLEAADLRIIGRARAGTMDVVREARGREQYEHRSIDLVLSVEYSYARPHHDWDMLLVAVTENKPAFTVSTDPEEVALPPGGKCEFVIKVDRKGANAGPLKISYQNLPRGVTASAADIPDGKTEVKVTLTAAADAPAEVLHAIVTGTIGNASATAKPLRISLVK